MSSNLAQSRNFQISTSMRCVDGRNVMRLGVMSCWEVLPNFGELKLGSRGEVIVGVFMRFT